MNTFITSRRRFTASIAALSLCGATPFAWGDAPFPQRPVRIVTPFSAGSGPDAALRMVAERLSRKWGQPVLVDNRPGANGFIAIEAVLKAPADGHELIQLDTQHMTTHPHLYRTLPYDPQRDFTPIRSLFITDFYIAVAKDSPFTSLDDIVRAARAQPGRVTYGSWFNGSPGHLGALRLQAMQGIEMLHVPYKDLGQLYVAVATGEVQWALGSAASAGALQKAGKLRFIAIAAPRRSDINPDVPSVDESAATRGYEVRAWTALFAPRGMAKPLRDRISADVAEALAAPELLERYRAIGFQPLDLGPDELAARITAETQAWSKSIVATGLKLD